jgi:hypothetical protein
MAKVCFGLTKMDLMISGICSVLVVSFTDRVGRADIDSSQDNFELQTACNETCT